MTDIVGVEWQGEHVAHVILNRPDKKNAMSLEMFAALPETAAKLAGSGPLRAVILRGAGGDFCAGLDLGVMQALAGRLDEVRAEMLDPGAGEIANFYQRPVTCWQDLRAPVIAAIDGVCFGAGMQLALAADFRIAAPGARFSIMEARWGLIPDMGITQSLPKLLRTDQAKELIMTARVLDAAEALAFGLITRVAEDPFGAARDLAEELSARSPDAVQAAKRLVDRGWHLQADKALKFEAELQAAIIGRPNQIEAVMANLQKRAPDFI